MGCDLSNTINESAYQPVVIQPHDGSNFYNQYVGQNHQAFQNQNSYEPYPSAQVNTYPKKGNPQQFSKV